MSEPRHASRRGAIEDWARSPRTVLADGDGVYHGHVHDLLIGRYRIVSVNAASVQVEDLPRGARMTLQLSGSDSPQQ